MVIGIVSAMESELALFRSKLENMQTRTFASVSYYSGTVNGKELVVCNCGVGKVNAAMHTQIMIDIFSPDIIINNGVAGALAAELDIFDVVVGITMVYHDMQDFVIEEFSPLQPEYHSDERLVSAVKEINPDAFSGTVASGDWFVTDSETKERILNKTNALCVDMESAAVAHTAFLNSVPFVIIRVMSDKADDSGHMSFHEFEKKAAQNSSEMTLKLIDIIDKRDIK